MYWPLGIKLLEVSFCCFPKGGTGASGNQGGQSCTLHLSEELGSISVEKTATGRNERNLYIKDSVQREHSFGSQVTHCDIIWEKESFPTIMNWQQHHGYCIKMGQQFWEPWKIEFSPDVGICKVISGGSGGVVDPHLEAWKNLERPWRNWSWLGTFWACVKCLSSQHNWMKFRDGL